MKLKSVVFIMLMAMCTVACSNDDDNKEGNVDNVAGTYNGYSSAAFKYSATPLVNDGDTVILSKVSDNQVSVTYKSKTWGNMKLDKATVLSTGNEYTIAGTGNISMGMSGATPKNYPCTFAGVIPNEKKDATFTLTVPSVMGGTVITIKEGNKPAK